MRNAMKRVEPHVNKARFLQPDHALNRFLAFIYKQLTPFLFKISLKKKTGAIVA